MTEKRWALGVEHLGSYQRSLLTDDERADQTLQAAYARSTRAVLVVCAPSVFLLISGLVSLIPGIGTIINAECPAYLAGLAWTFLGGMLLGLIGMIGTVVVSWVRDV